MGLAICSVVKRPALLHNSFTFRLGLLYLLLFIVSSFILFSFIYYANTRSLQQQLSNRLQSEAALFNDRYQQFGLNGVIRLLAFRAQNQDELAVYALSDQNNEILAGTIDSWPSVPTTLATAEFTLSLEEGQPDQEISARVITLDKQYKILIGKTKLTLKNIQRRLIQTFLSASIITLVLGLLGGLWLSKRAVRRIEKISKLVNTTIQGDLTQRLTLRDPVDDLDHLSININLMLDRIQSLMSDVSGVANNIAHDLRTPLSHLRLQLEQLQETNRDNLQAKQQVEAAIGSVDHILETFNALLRISKVESTKRRESFAYASITQIIEDVIELYEPLAEEKQQSLVATQLDYLRLNVDKDLLFQALSNLVDNAIKYTPVKTDITVQFRISGNIATLSVCDHGLGVEENDATKLARRFYRTDKSRSTQGNGLGLSLVEAIAKLHHGELRIYDNKPGLCAVIEFDISKLNTKSELIA